MNALIDEDLHRSLGKVLSQLGFTVYDIRDLGLRGIPDYEVFCLAQKKKAVLFSADLGFSSILSFPLGSHYGIAILRFPNEMPTDYINQMVYTLLTKLNPDDYFGNLIIISAGRLRIKRYKEPN